MTVFWREYSDRESHWAERNEWGQTGACNPTTRQKDDWVYNHVRKGSVPFNIGLFPNAVCPQCKDKVYFYRHKSGGCAWFDDVPWPWTKHRCMDIQDTKCNSEYIREQEIAVAKAKKLAEREPIWAVFQPARFYHLSDPRDRAFATINNEWKTQTPLDWWRAFIISLGEYSASYFQRSENFKMIQGDQLNDIIKYFDQHGENIFHVNNSQEVNIPLVISRSIRWNNTNIICAYSALVPEVGIWLETEIGMEAVRNVDAILSWHISEPNNKTVFFLNNQTGRINWRDEVSIVGAFNSLLHLRIEKQ